MLLIVAHHYVVNSGLIPLMEAESLAPRSLYLYLIGMWGKTGINCFVLITGYFMCTSQITLRKFLKLLLEIEFYKVVIHLTFCLTGYIDFSLMEFLWHLLPVHDVSDDFVACYLVFFLFIPFLNVMIRNIDKRQHLWLVVFSVGIYSLWNILPGITVDSNDSIWFCILYFVASYLRLYPLKTDGNTRFWTMATTCSIVAAMASVIAMIYRNNHGYIFGPYFLVGCPWIPLALLVSVCAFMMFKNMNIRQSSLINIIGGGTFGVLLIHANSDTMRRWLWRDVCDNVGHYGSSDIYIHALLVPVIVFIVCSAIEYVRMKTIEKPLMDFVYRLIQQYIIKRI